MGCLKKLKQQERLKITASIKMKEEYEEEEDTNFDGSDPQSTSLEKKANTTSSDTFPKTTHYSTSHQNVLHFLLLLLL